MNIEPPTFRHRQPLRHRSWWARSARLLGYGSGLFAVSTFLTFALVHDLLQRVLDAPTGFQTILKADLLWPLLALSVVVTLANHTAIASLRRLLRRWRPTVSRDERLPPTPSAPRQAAGLSRQVLQLTRGAERLDLVERDLIRKISESSAVDTATRQLLTEMRICTNRLRGQISDIERLEQMTEPDADRGKRRSGRQVKEGSSV